MVPVSREEMLTDATILFVVNVIASTFDRNNYSNDGKREDGVDCKTFLISFTERITYCYSSHMKIFISDENRTLIGFRCYFGVCCGLMDGCTS